MSCFGQGIDAFQTCAAANEKIFKFLAETEMPAQEDTKTIEKIKGSVEFENVEFGYTSDKVIINNFSAKIEPGMKVAIVGPTGAGKTTIVNLLMRFYEINKGKILIDGIDTKDMSQEYLRSIFGMVLQDP
jgi:ATP-binding cassette subfamily B protein